MTPYPSGVVFSASSDLDAKLVTMLTLLAAARLVRFTELIVEPVVVLTCDRTIAEVVPKLASALAPLQTLVEQSAAVPEQKALLVVVVTTLVFGSVVPTA